MGKFFNEHIMNMPSSALRKLKKSVLVKHNPVYGQTKGYLEQMRKDFNKSGEEAPLYVSDKDKKKNG